MSVIYTGSPESSPMKAVISETIAAVAEEDKKVIYLDADLMSCIGTKAWADQHPEQAVNCGIAEADMIGIAAGLSSQGYKPIVHSFGVFASRRCFDQVFLSCGYAANPIVIIGSDPGVCAEYNGGTHMPLEDAALMRTIPYSTVVEASDASMFRSVLRQLKDRGGVNYIRVGRKMYAKIYSADHEFRIGRGEILRNGKDVVIVAAGVMLEESMKAAQQLEEKGVSAAVIDMFTIKPLDRELLRTWAEITGCVVTAENHCKIGGLYSAVCEALAEDYPVPVRGVAVDNMFGEVGDKEYLKNRFSLTAEKISEKAMEAISAKKDQHD